MERTPVNPWHWSVEMSFNQAELVQGADRVLFCAGQVAVDENGAPQHPGDMQAQLTLAVDNLEVVLRAADMTLANVVRLNYYTTDVDGFMAALPAVNGRILAAAGIAPPGTLLGVTRLLYPELLVEVEATAVA